MLFAKFSGSQTESSLLFGGLPRGQQIPNRLTARLTLKHPDIALFAPHLLMKALKQTPFGRPIRPAQRIPWSCPELVASFADWSNLL